MGGWHSEFTQFCKVCNKETDHESDSYDDEYSITCLEHEDIDEKQFNASMEIIKLQSLNIDTSIQSLLHNNHTESNCQCQSENGTETMRSEGAGDIEVCLDCFGAKGCVY